MITRHIQGKIHHRIVEHGDTVYIGGLVATDKTKDMKGQAQEIFGKLDELLAQAGTSKEKLLQVMIYSAAFDQKDAFNEAWCEWLSPETFPVRAYIGGAELSPGTLVEVVTVASK
ncbi:RidA family protein [Salipiger thiooxidans]|jgi:enamine deaminase RidA (YjgF/YER057c/UK114 family)|uniref:RidA family protein n=1 Tax=Salipiger thiooxidans TaxID=282683 RepID=UPI001CD2144B|nr:RidA family protein [Salipiger thiooxidans]MCA0848594.1 RidA family protein [Salipiger thiooxidans]